MTSTMPLTSVAEVEAGTDACWWAHEQDAVSSVLADHYGRGLSGLELTEPRDPADLRGWLRAAAPRLTALTDRIQVAFEQDQACAVVVPSLGVAGVAVDAQRKALFALSVLLGDPMANHPDETVVWDVRNRSWETARPKASDSDRRAGYHTDAGYLPMPPRFFLLYAARAARCGGGVSLIKDGRIVLHRLAQTEQGRAAIEALSQNVPRYVPTNLQPWAHVDADGCQRVPMLGDKPMWRWSARRTKGVLEQYPELAPPGLLEAIDTVRQEIKRGPGESRLWLDTDRLLVVDNHAALHARTAFTDQERNLFRIRFHEAGEPR